MPWLTLTFRGDAGAAQVIADLLDEAGALAVTMRDAGEAPVLEPPPGEAPVWAQTSVQGLFDPRDPAPLLAWLRSRYAPGELPSVSIDRLEDRDWVREGVAGIGPLRFGDRLWVCPSWKEPPEPSGVTLRLDPGLAFGTGTHPTTALCLEWLAGADLAGAVVVDYGSGSGILGVAALLLGARQVWAVDHDPQALDATRDNAARNGVLAGLRAVAPESLPEPHADLVVANILARPLEDLAPRLVRLARPGGRLILAGVLAEQVEALCQAYRPWVALMADAERDGWVRLVGARPTGGPD
jgi:ribosomal protein L11 methyltransferase